MEKVLEWVNKMRASIGSPPIQQLVAADKLTYDGCVIAKSIGSNTTVGIRRCHVGGKRSEIMPDYVTAFIRDVFKGKYPELYKPKTERNFNGY